MDGVSVGMGCKACHLDSDKGGTASASCLNSRVSKSWAAAGVAALSLGKLMSSPRAPSNCPALHLPSACAPIDHAMSPALLVYAKGRYKDGSVHTCKFNKYSHTLLPEIAWGLCADSALRAVLRYQAFSWSGCCAGTLVLACSDDATCQHVLRQQDSDQNGKNNTSRSCSARSWWLVCSSGCSCRLALPACRMAKSAAQWCGVVQACAHSKAHAAMSPRPRKTCTSGMLSHTEYNRNRVLVAFVLCTVVGMESNMVQHGLPHHSGWWCEQTSLCFGRRQ